MSNPQSELPVLVAGGGIGGLAAALALVRQGFKVQVFEQAPEIGEIGAGIQLGPNAFHAFDALGVGDKARGRAVYTDYMVMHDAIDETQVGKIETGEAFRARYWADPVGAPGRMAALFAAAGIEQVTESDIAIRQDFSDFEDWWDPWAAGGQGIAGAFIAALPPERIAPIKDIARRAYLAGGADGPRSFVAVARLAVGRKPIRP